MANIAPIEPQCLAHFEDHLERELLRMMSWGIGSLQQRYDPSSTTVPGQRLGKFHAFRITKRIARGHEVTIPDSLRRERVSFESQASGVMAAIFHGALSKKAERGTLRQLNKLLDAIDACSRGNVALGQRRIPGLYVSYIDADATAPIFLCRFGGLMIVMTQSEAASVIYWISGASAETNQEFQGLIVPLARKAA